jgi:hypothetical protein
VERLPQQETEAIPKVGSWRRFWALPWWRKGSIVVGVALLVAIIVGAATGGASCSTYIEIGGGTRELDEDDVDENLRSFVDDAIVSIFSPPSFEALVSRSAPELAAVEDHEPFFDDLTGRTGALEEYGITDVRVFEADMFETGDPIRVAVYRAEVVFENGPGFLELDVTKRGGDLQITRWFIGGPARIQ